MVRRPHLKSRLRDEPASPRHPPGRPLLLSAALTKAYGRLRTAKTDEELVPFPPNDPQRGDTFADRIKALLRLHGYTGDERYLNGHARHR